MKAVTRIVVAVVAIAMCSCLAPQNSLMVGVDIHSWSEAKSLMYENSDTLMLRNINIAVRYNDDFKCRVLPLKITVTTPDARTFEEVVELQLQHPNAALATSTTESIPYRTDVLLNQIGGYTFTFESQCEVRGMEAIGIEFK